METEILGRIFETLGIAATIEESDGRITVTIPKDSVALSSIMHSIDEIKSTIAACAQARIGYASSDNCQILTIPRPGLSGTA